MVKTAASYIAFERDQTEEDELSSMSCASELTETLNSKLLLVTSSSCFGHVGLNSCHEGIDSPLCCSITKPMQTSAAGSTTIGAFQEDTSHEFAAC